MVAVYAPARCVGAGPTVPPRKIEPRPCPLKVMTNDCLGSNPTWLPMFCDCEYPASLPPNATGSVAPPGPVSSAGSVKVT